MRLGREKRRSFLRACQRKGVDFTPVWFMRQAGRYLPEFRQIRQNHSVIEICKKPELSAEVTLLPIRRFDLDAAIIFADIMLPLEPMGVKFRIEDGVGPVIENPIQDLGDVEQLNSVDPKSDLPFVLESVRLVKQKLPDGLPLIGFSGGPFTLASYLIEGSPSRDFVKTKRLMYSQPETWYNLMRELSEMIIKYLRAQISAGVDAVQLFDTWVGCLGPKDYGEQILPFTRHIFNSIRSPGIPLIHFSTGTAGHLELIRETGADVVSIDWRINIDDAWKITENSLAIQGNLDPAVLLGNWDLVESRASDIIQRVGGRRGHIFNLGHGILPNTPVENVESLVNLVHKATASR